MSDLQPYIPLILAALGFLTALLQYLKKHQAVKVVDVLVDVIEHYGHDGMKKKIAVNADSAGVGDMLHGIVKRRTP